MAILTIRPADHGPLLSGIEAAGQSWDAGMLLTFSSGKLAALIAKGASSNAPATIVGIANAPSTGVTDTIAPYTPITSTMLFEATLENSDADPYTMLQTDIGAEYGITVTAAGIAYVDKYKTAGDACFHIVEGEVGTVQARVRGYFIADTLLTKGS